MMLQQETNPSPDSKKHDKNNANGKLVWEKVLLYKTFFVSANTATMFQKSADWL